MKKTGFRVEGLGFSKKWLIAVILTLIPKPCLYAANYYVACVYDFSGNVKVFKAAKSQWQAVFKYMPLEEKDAIRTSPASFCEIVMDDGTMLKLDENTELVLKQLKYEMQKQKYRFGIKSGKVLGSINKLKTAAASVTFKTPTAVAAVRGTELAIIASSDSANIGLFDGKLSVASAGDEEEEEAEEESGFLAPTTRYAEAPSTPTVAPAAPTPQKKEVILEPNKEVMVGIQKKVVVQDYLSRIMEKEKRRAERLREIAEKVREKLKERSDYLQAEIQKQQEKLKDWDKRREEKLKRYKKSE